MAMEPCPFPLLPNLNSQTDSNAICLVWLAVELSTCREVLRIARVCLRIFQNALSCTRLTLGITGTSHVPCKFFRQGACQAGKACPFLHSTDTTTDIAPCKYFTKVRETPLIRLPS